MAKGNWSDRICNWAISMMIVVPAILAGGSTSLAQPSINSITVTERTARLAQLLKSADVIVESAVALTQEIHDGPLETYTGHGLWAAWQGHPTFSLHGKTLIRIDLDPALEKVWQAERQQSGVQDAINRGLPKTKVFGVPFRMEMSGFARLEGSIAIISDIGVAWPVLARHLAERLGVTLQFISYPQESDLGRAMRDWIVSHIKPLNRQLMLDACAAHTGQQPSARRHQAE